MVAIPPSGSLFPSLLEWCLCSFRVVDAIISAMTSPIGEIISPLFDFVYGNKYICKTPYWRTFFVVVDIISWSNARSRRRSIFSNIKIWGNYAIFLTDHNSCWIWSVIIWYSSWYHSHWGHPENILEPNNLHDTIFTVFIYIIYHTFSYLAWFSVHQISPL